MKFHRLDYKKHKILMYKGLRWNSVCREPDTVRWIERMKPGSVLYDVGCHVGAFSLIAAKRGVIVYGFEPSMTTFNILMKNIIKNKCQEKIFAISIPMDSRQKLSFFYYKTLSPKKAGHNFGKPMCKNGIKQLMISESIDNLVNKYNLPIPNYIKIDIDGNEYEVLQGAKETLTSKQCYSVLVETVHRLHGKIISRSSSAVNDFLEKYDFKSIGIFSGRNQIYMRDYL